MTVYRLTAKGVFYNQEWRNVWYANITNQAVDELQEDIDDIHEVYRDNLQTSWVVACTLYAWDAKDMEVAQSPSLEYLPSQGSVVGVVATPGTASQVAFLNSYKSLTVPPNKVRKYIPGFPENSIDANGFWAANIFAAVEAFGEGILDVGLQDPNRAFPVSARLDENNVVTDWNTMTESFPRTVPATQRRRRIGVGI